MDKESEMFLGQEKLFEHVKHGMVAYHHSGLSYGQRTLIENLYRDSRVLKVIFCTSTLAAGVNLPANRVIISGIQQGRFDILSPILYKQMVGRAGRVGLCSLEADSYVCVHKNKILLEKDYILGLMANNTS